MRFSLGFMLMLAVMTSGSLAFKFRNDEAAEAVADVSRDEPHVVVGEEVKVVDKVPEEESILEHELEGQDSAREEREIDPLVEDVQREVIIEAKEAVDESQEEEVQGRFFLKDKLCALGLMSDVSRDNYFLMTN